jgi:PAS domain S-box-containing protein
VPDARFRELLRYVRWTDADEAHLALLHRVASPHFPEIATEFYERIREHAEAHAVFTGEEQIARLQKSLVRWLDRVCTGARDVKYFTETAQIGRVHVKVGLPQRYVFTAMSLIAVALGRIADRTLPDSKSVRDTVTRALDIELAIMLGAYHDDFVERVRRVERMEKERALARNEQIYVQAVELAPSLVVGLDAEEKIRMFNRAAERVTSFDRDEVIGRRFGEVLLADAVETELATRIADTLAGRREAETLEAPLLTKAGHARIVRWRFAHSPGEPSDAIVSFAIGIDVTDEAAQVERARRTEKLAAVGTLAAGLAHEIRNPLNGAHLHVTFLERDLKKTGASTEALDAVHVVSDEIQRLAQLVNDFLAFARPKPLDKSKTSIRDLCEHVVAIVTADADAARVKVEKDLPKSDVVLDADRARLEQVLLNLLRNGIEALAPVGGGRVVLRARRLPFAAVIEIEDDGPGIPAGSPPIFDAFYSTKSTGTGLGLAIVHRIVSDHGGTIAYESKPGHTVFRVTLPIEAIE